LRVQGGVFDSAFALARELALAVVVFALARELAFAFNLAKP
jgi:hypothetical protein